MLLLILVIDCKAVNTLFSDKVLQIAINVASADSDMKIFVSAAFFSKTGRI